MKFEYFQNGTLYFLEMPDYLKKRVKFTPLINYIFNFQTKEECGGFFSKEFNAKISYKKFDGEDWVLVSFVELEEVRIAARTLNKQIKKFSLSKLKEQFKWN